MSAEPITQDMIDCWRVNYGLDTRSPEEAARYWHERCAGMAPAGAVAALGLLLAERATLDAAVAAARADFERECSDTDKILRALGLDPTNCRTDGGSLVMRELLGAIEHRDVMTRRAARQAERERCAKIAETVRPHWTHIARAIREDQP